MANSEGQEETIKQISEIHRLIVSQESEAGSDDANSISLSSGLSMTRKLISELITLPKTCTKGKEF